MGYSVFGFGAGMIVWLCSAMAHAQLVVTDDAGRELRLAGPARRIVALAPHVTEVLFAAGAGDRIVGAVEYSDFPEAAKAIPRVGGYSNVDMEAVAALRPDLVIAWKSGNRSANLNRLEALGIPIYMNEARSIEGVARSIEIFGMLAGTEPTAAAAAAEFRRGMQALAERHAQRPTVRVFYQFWNRPMMTVNGEHLISDVIRLCGGENIFASLPRLAPTVGVEGVLAADPEVIVASGTAGAQPEWLDAWRRWSSLLASRNDNFYFLPSDLIQRHTPRILDGATLMCGFLEEARSKRPR